MKSGIQEATANETVDEPRESLGVGMDLFDDLTRKLANTK
jgi:hypothetical protein